MKKSILLACVAVMALSAPMAEAKKTTVHPTAQVVAAAVAKSSVEEIKTAWTKTILKNSPAAGKLYDFKNMTVEQNGDNFAITLKGIPQTVQAEEGEEAKTFTLPDMKIPLTYAGEFNGKAQYRIGDAWNNVLAICKSFIPAAVITTTKAEVETLWVPAYYLRPKNSINIQELKVMVPNMPEMSVGSLVSDVLARVVKQDKMDIAAVTDVRNVMVKKDGITLNIPTINAKHQINRSPITGDAAIQTFQAESETLEFDVPAVIATMEGNPEPVLTMALKGNGSFEKGVFKYSGSINNIHMGDILPVPSVYIPTSAAVDFEIDNITEDFYHKMAALNGAEIEQEELNKQINENMKDLVFKINKAELKNAQASLSISGTSKAEKTKNNTYVQGFDGKLVITNLDQISPVPKVDEVACQDAKKNAENMPKENADQMIAYACTARGGMFDVLRPYLKPENRTTDKDTTTDTIAIQFGAKGLFLNGIAVQPKAEVQ